MATRTSLAGKAVVVGLLAVAVALPGCNNAEDPWKDVPGGQPRVLVSFAPLYCFAKAVAGPDVAVLSLLKDVGHPWCSHVLDTGQYLGSPGAAGAGPDDARRYDLYQSIARTAPLAVLVRAKLYRLRSGKEEWLDYDRIFKILRGVKYNGFVCLVYEGWTEMDAPHAVPIGVKFLRPYLARS